MWLLGRRRKKAPQSETAQVIKNHFIESLEPRIEYSRFLSSEGGNYAGSIEEKTFYMKRINYKAIVITQQVMTRIF